MKYQNPLSDDITQCTICPRNCKLKKGQHGFCHVRENYEGNIVLNTYGYNTGLAVDPIEKKPLYHFYPGTKVLSFGTLGCNMGCMFCQNWHISKSKQNSKTLMPNSPKEIVEMAKKYGCKSVAFTYNDPVIFFEYAIDTAKICHENGIKTVAVTAGYINPEPRKEFFQYIDAVNIDLKGFSEKFYTKNCLAHLDPILDTIKYVKNETQTHLELTTLLIEGENDDDETLQEEITWIMENLGDQTPLHFSAFFPAYKFLNTPPTSKETLFKAYNLARKMGLKYVYLGNILNIETATTICPRCKMAVIKRDGYNVSEINLIEDKCKFCGYKINGQF